MQDQKGQTALISPRDRVNTILEIKLPDRTPVDFLAVPEIWEGLLGNENTKRIDLYSPSLFNPAWEQLLQTLEVDCRVISYDQFCSPPDSILNPESKIGWYSSPSRSTPNRMWRQITPGNQILDIWGRHFKIVEHPYGAYEELASFPLNDALSVTDLKGYSWPEPDWWDFTPVPKLLEQLDEKQEYHLRYRIGSVFEVAWQLMGMERFLLDLAIDPKIPAYIMEQLTEIYVEKTRRFLTTAGNRVDMVYFYDDVATQDSLLISKQMWKEFIKPHHARIIDVAKSFNKKVMYHCDGALYPLLPDLVDLGIDVLNPIQTDAKDMDPVRLKEEFGDRLCFHGGINIVETLPKGSPGDVQREVKTRIKELGYNGGYVLASSHHIQAETPLANVRAMYAPSIRSLEDE